MEGSQSARVELGFWLPGAWGNLGMLPTLGRRGWLAVSLAFDASDWPVCSAYARSNVVPCRYRARSDQSHGTCRAIARIARQILDKPRCSREQSRDCGQIFLIVIGLQIYLPRAGRLHLNSLFPSTTSATSSSCFEQRQRGPSVVFELPT